MSQLDIPVANDAVAISSFAWALPIALTGELSELSQWSSTSGRLHTEFAKTVRRHDRDGEDLPLDMDHIQAVYAWLLDELQLPVEYTRPPRFAIRAFQDFRLKDPPDPLLLNSFFLGDLARAQTCFANGSAPAALKYYVGSIKPPLRRDLLHDHSALEEVIRPLSIPLARWPSPGRHPLVLLQQAAVNLALKDASTPGIVAVNGPPGTGKTTLLRDVVAAHLCKRNC